MPRSAVTFAALLAAYGVSGMVATALLGPSPAWFLVLGADFILVTFCTLLARMAADNKNKEASIEALGIGIGTVAQLGTHALQFFLQVLAGQTDAGTDSVVGATIQARWPLHADAIYLVVLIIACVFCAAVAAVGAIYARQSQQHAWSLGVAILLLVASTLFLLPWLGITPHRQSASPLNALAALAVITALLWGSNLLLRSLLVAAHLAGQATWAVLQVAFGAAIVGVVILALYSIVSFFVHVAGPLFDMFRVLATALAWFVGAAVLLAVVVMLTRAIAGLLGRAIERVARMSPRSRMLALAACAVLGIGTLFFAGRDGSRPPPPPPPVRVVFEEVPIACAGFRWEYGETHRISAPAANCLVYAEADILVAVGSATPPGGPDTEPERALQRGRALSDAIVSHLDTERRNPRVLVLNRGIETPPVADDIRLGPHLAVLAGTVTPRGAQLDDAILQRDLSGYLRGQESGSSYSHCDLYALAALTPLFSLDCNSPDRRG